MKAQVPFLIERLKIDPAREIDRIAAGIQEIVFKQLRRKGIVIGLSGGIDSSVVASLCVKALGKNRVLGLLMPEMESSPQSLKLGRLMAKHLDIETVQEEITPILKAAGCYQRRDDAIRKVIPGYREDHKCKLVLDKKLDSSGYRIFSILVRSPEGIEIKKRLTGEAYLGIVAASSFKQRARKMMEYYHADRLQFAVAGTPNRLEYDQGFFVKNGDGAADLKPIAHLYKSQVYQMALSLDIPEEIQMRQPTTDTYPLPQSQEEFFFLLPYEKMDLCLYGKNHSVPPSLVAAATGLTADQVAHVYRDIEQTRSAVRHLHMEPFLFDSILGD